MLDPYQDSTTRASDFFQPLQAYLETSFPRTPEAFFEMEQRLYKTAARAGDDIVLRQIVAAHDDRDFVKHAVAEARATSAVPLLHTG
jgi:hypothetical protein